MTLNNYYLKLFQSKKNKIEMKIINVNNVITKLGIYKNVKDNNF